MKANSKCHGVDRERSSMDGLLCHLRTLIFSVNYEQCIQQTNNEVVNNLKNEVFNK